jgi:hypothetical protein
VGTCFAAAKSWKSIFDEFAPYRPNTRNAAGVPGWKLLLGSALLLRRPRGSHFRMLLGQSFRRDHMSGSGWHSSDVSPSSAVSFREVEFSLETAG